MKKKQLTELTVRELIEELKAKAGGVINTNYRLETRNEYRQYLNEILDELGKRDLSEEEKKELEKVFPSPVAEEVAEEVTETPVVEEVTEEVTETPVVEEVTEEVTETPVVEEVTEEVTETPVVEEVTEEVTETNGGLQELPDGSENTSNQKETDDEPNGLAKVFKWFLGILGVGAFVGILIMLLLMNFGKENNQVFADDGVETDVSTESSTENKVDTDVSTDSSTENKTDTGISTDSAESKFDMDAFSVSVQNIAKQLTEDKEIATNVDLFVEKVGEDKLKELVGKNGELNVQKAIAEFLVFVPEIKMNQYINNKGLDYNPDAANDWYDKLDEASEAYKEATGKNPEGALMSLEGYDTHKSNREAMKALIIESGDTALLTWYEAKTSGYDVMVEQQNDTKAAEEYKEEVKLELVTNINGSIKLIELQLNQQVNGTDPNTLNYAEAYKEFIINNYMYVVAN